MLSSFWRERKSKRGGVQRRMKNNRHVPLFPLVFLPSDLHILQSSFLQSRVLLSPSLLPTLELIEQNKNPLF